MGYARPDIFLATAPEAKDSVPLLAGLLTHVKQELAADPTTSPGRAHNQKLERLPTSGCDSDDCAGDFGDQALPQVLDGRR